MIDGAERRSLVQEERGRIELGRLADLPSHAILDRGRLVGLWEYVPDAQSIAWVTLGKPSVAVKKAVQAGRFVREDVGDPLAFSLDSPKSRALRIAALPAAGL